MLNIHHDEFRFQTGPLQVGINSATRNGDHPRIGWKIRKISKPSLCVAQCIRELCLTVIVRYRTLFNRDVYCVVQFNVAPKTGYRGTVWLKRNNPAITAHEFPQPHRVVSYVRADI